MKILIGYDGSASADAVIVTASELLAGSDPEAIVLTIWGPVLTAELHAARLGSPMAMSAIDTADLDGRSERQAGKLAQHGARLARQHGFDAKPLSVANNHDVASAILDEASKFDVDLVVLDTRGLAGIRASWEASLTTSSSTPGVPSSSSLRGRHAKVKRSPIRPRSSSVRSRTQLARRRDEPASHRVDDAGPWNWNHSKDAMRRHTAGVDRTQTKTATKRRLWCRSISTRRAPGEPDAAPATAALATRSLTPAPGCSPSAATRARRSARSRPRPASTRP
jgi:nucleotide-binding universal stress UspA family protein